MLRASTHGLALLAGLVGVLAVPSGAAAKPEGPRKLSIAVKQGDVVLRWRPLPAARRYRVFGTAVGSPARGWKRRPLSVTQRHRFRQRGLTPGVTYKYRVVARLRNGRTTRAARTLRITIPGGNQPHAPEHEGAGLTPRRPKLPPPTRFVAPGGSDAGACTAATPCATFSRAYVQARPGEVVAVAAGSYGRQTIRRDGRAAGSARVYFVPAAGAAVTTGEIEVSGNSVEFWDMTTSGWYVETGADGVAFRGVAAQGTIFITSASNVEVIGGSVGPGDSTDSQIKAANTNGAPPPTGILIDGVDFHDWTRHQDPNAHVECLQVGAAVNITIRNSKFRNCETQGLFFRSWGGTATIANVVIENNWFDRTTVGYYPVKISQMDGQVYENISIRYNSGLQPFIIDPGSSRNVTWVGNVAPRTSSACASGQTFRYNVWDGAACGPTDRNARLSFVDAAGMDLHLSPTSPAIDAGDPGDRPAADIDGEARPRGGLPDAGADER